MSEEDQGKRRRPSSRLRRHKRPANPIPADARPRKATRVEIRARITQVSEWLCEGHRKHEIKRFCRDQWGIGPRQVETYLRLARASLVEAAGQPRDILVAQSLGFLMSVLHDSSARARDRVAACKEANSLLGLHAPTKIAPVTPEGKPLPMIFNVRPEDLTDDELALLLRMKHRLAPHGPTPITSATI